MRLLKNYDTSLGTQLHYQATRLLGYECWVVTEPFVYNLGDSKYVCVPTGFLTDGASVPRVLWNIVPPWGVHGQAAVMHDYLCEYGIISNGTSYEPVTRKQADEIFLRGLEDIGVGALSRTFMYAGVSAYRFIVKPTSPNKNKSKEAVEKMIMGKYARTGSFILSDKEYSAVDLLISLGK